MNKLSPKISKTYKLSYVAPTTWRQIFLIKDNPLHKKKEKYIYDRCTTISPIYEGMRVYIYNGKKFQTKYINRWMTGFKFGEFTWNRKLALYKAKQLKKKSKK